MKRKTQFSKNLALENLLKDLNDLLVTSQEKVLSRYTATAFPPVFIVGCPRSGTTLLLQWLAGSKCFAYPSNFISRFYGSPYIGALIQQMLLDPEFAFNDEMRGMSIHTNDWFKSNLGKTDGLLSPNEFWYFWRRYFHYNEIQHLDDSKLKQIDIDALRSEFAALEDVFKLPLLMKALIINWNLDFIAKHIDNSVFLYIKRNSFFNIQSLLKARLKYFNNIREWYSFKPVEYELLKDEDAFSQVAGQVYFTNLAIKNGLSSVSSSRWIEIGYENLCHSPKSIWENISMLLYKNGYKLDLPYDGPAKFKCLNEVKITEFEKEKIHYAYKRFEKKKACKKRKHQTNCKEKELWILLS